MNDWNLFFIEAKDEIKRRKLMFEEPDNKRRYRTKR